MGECGKPNEIEVCQLFGCLLSQGRFIEPPFFVSPHRFEFHQIIRCLQIPYFSVLKNPYPPFSPCHLAA
jgi:hypothetical protein